MAVSRDFGFFGEEKSTLWTLKNDFAELSVSDCGARLVSLVVPDKNGAPTDVVLGYDSAEGYWADCSTFFGATVGRVANRIERGFELDGRFYKLPVNDGEHNCLHGGSRGFDRRVWSAEAKEDSVTFFRVSPDGEEGFPGRVEVSVTYSLLEDGLSVAYSYVSDLRTPVCLSNHAYFNLNGEGNGDVLSHLLTISADRYSAVDAALIPRESRSTAGTAFDFTAPKTIGGAQNDGGQFAFTKYFDHSFILSGTPAARAEGDVSGIRMELFTDLPCVQFYAGNCIGERSGKGGRLYRDNYGFCLETQYAPNSAASGEYPEVFANPGETRRSVTRLAFSAR